MLINREYKAKNNAIYRFLSLNGVCFAEKKYKIDGESIIKIEKLIIIPIALILGIDTKK